MNRTRLLASVLVAAFALILASCGGGTSTNPSASGTASIRFINGSPDAGAFDVLINGKVIASNIAYGQISSYQTITVGGNPLPQVAFVKTGTEVNIFPPVAGTTQGQTFQMGAAAGTKVSIVVEGEASYVGARALSVGAFIEPTVSNSSGTYAIVFHHASPLAELASPKGLAVGEVLLSTPAYYVIGSMVFNSTSGTTSSIFGLQSQTAVNGPPGIGFYVGPLVVATATPVPVTPTPTPSPTPTATSSAPAVAPSPTLYAAIMPGPPTALPAAANTGWPVTGVDAANVNQSMPYNNDQALFVYVIDSNTTSSGVTLIGTFNN